MEARLALYRPDASVENSTGPTDISRAAFERSNPSRTQDSPFEPRRQSAGTTLAKDHSAVGSSRIRVSSHQDVVRLKTKATQVGFPDCAVRHCPLEICAVKYRFVWYLIALAVRQERVAAAVFAINGLTNQHLYLCLLEYTHRKSRSDVWVPSFLTTYPKDSGPRSTYSEL